MAISSEARRTPIYKGDGEQTLFSFSFKLLKPTHLEVRVALDGESETTLDPSAYSAVLNSDQDNNPGGSVTLNEPLAAGASLVIISATPYLQQSTYTNRGGFYPQNLNNNLDMLTILTQQLLEKVDRAITTDATDTMTAQELKQKLLSAADSAFIVASQKAEEAKVYAQAAANSAQFAADTVADLPAQTALRIEEINAAAQAAGDHEIARIRAEGDNELIAAGMGCGEVTWTLSESVASGAEITIPGGIKYLVGRKHLRLSWNGCVLYRGQNFDEVGQDDTFSTTIKLLFDAQTGDELNAWVGALGKGEIAEAVNIANQALDSVSALSQRVVYKDEQAAS